MSPAQVPCVALQGEGELVRVWGVLDNGRLCVAQEGYDCLEDT